MEFNKFQNICGDLNVSRETFERLQAYEAEIKKWNPKINLVAPKSLDDLWMRHFVDSLQILSHVDPIKNKWLDLGTGGGFPGLVLAAALPEINFTFIESDQRKCAFLRKATREMSLNTVTVISERIEEAEIQNADYISARALADLDLLLKLATPHGNAETIYIFPKGKNWENELTLAKENWQMEVETAPSQTDAEARILFLKKVFPK